MHMYLYRHPIMYTPHVQFICTPTLPLPLPPHSNLSTTHDMRDDTAEKKTPHSPSNATYPVGVALPFECDML